MSFGYPKEDPPVLQSNKALLEQWQHSSTYILTLVRLYLESSDLNLIDLAQVSLLDRSLHNRYQAFLQY